MNAATNLKPVHLAAAEQNGSIDFLLATHDAGGSKRVPLRSQFMYYYDEPQVVSVPARRLDDVFAGQQFDIIFMDIEGSEHFAFQGVDRLLGTAQTVFFKFIPHHLRNVAGVSPEEFATPLRRHFPHLYVPGHGRDYQGEAMVRVLRELYEREQAVDQMVVSKTVMSPCP